jgi:hypothetical protein
LRGARSNQKRGRRERKASEALGSLIADRDSAAPGIRRKLSIHFPEGGFLTLTFEMTRQEIKRDAYIVESYQLTDVDPNINTNVN